jgi:hypothetical protein
MDVWTERQTDICMDRRIDRQTVVVGAQRCKYWRIKLDLIRDPFETIITVLKMHWNGLLIKEITVKATNTLSLS